MRAVVLRVRALSRLGTLLGGAHAISVQGVELQRGKLIGQGLTRGQPTRIEPNLVTAGP